MKDRKLAVVRGNDTTAEPLTAESRKRDGRRKLLAAATEVFAEKAYAGATTKEIAKRAGVTEPMLFRHFGSKAALFKKPRWLRSPNT